MNRLLKKTMTTCLVIVALIVSNSSMAQSIRPTQDAVAIYLGEIYSIGIIAEDCVMRDIYAISSDPHVVRVVSVEQVAINIGEVIFEGRSLGVQIIKVCVDVESEDGSIYTLLTTIVVEVKEIPGFTFLQQELPVYMYAVKPDGCCVWDS